MSRMPLTPTLWHPSKMSSTCTHGLVLLSGLSLPTAGSTSDSSDQNDASNDRFLQCLPVERWTHGKCLCWNAGLWVSGGGNVCAALCILLYVCLWASVTMSHSWPWCVLLAQSFRIIVFWEYIFFFWEIPDILKLLVHSFLSKTWKGKHTWHKYYCFYPFAYFCESH